MRVRLFAYKWDEFSNVKPFKRVLLDDVKPIARSTATVVGIASSHPRQTGPLIFLNAVHKAVITAFKVLVESSASDEEIEVSIVRYGSANSISSLLSKLNVLRLFCIV